MKIKLIGIAILCCFLLSFTMINGKKIYDKDIYTNPDKVNICNYVNTQKIFALRCKHVKDTIFIGVYQVFTESPDKKPIIDLKKGLGIYFFRIENNIEVELNIFMSEYNTPRLPDLFLQEKENIDKWIKIVIKNNKFSRTPSPWNEYKISFNYCLFPEK